ncbi:hypothetical protein [Mycobacterium sp.]|uniref:hypothetical protein n=1 Tax=Mycobacterium sp. TaxID=1785 RepID=UPI003BAAA743
MKIFDIDRRTLQPFEQEQQLWKMSRAKKVIIEQRRLIGEFRRTKHFHLGKNPGTQRLPDL